MKVACLSFTDKGRDIGRKLEKYGDKKDFLEICHYENSEVEGGIKSIFEKIVKEYEGIVFISATGIAVRMISPYIIDKTVDPAVVVVDDLGRYSISLLSGHIGGGNRLCEIVGEILGAKPIITTASDGRNIEAVDIFAMRKGYVMENMEEVKKITSMMVNDKRIGYFSEMEGHIKYDNLVFIYGLENIKEYEDKLDGVLCISSIKQIDINIPHVILRPKNLNIGVGCKKGTSGKEIINAILDVLDKNNFSSNSIKSINTIEIKSDELGILEAASYFKCTRNIYTIEEIKMVEEKFEKSDFVKRNVGVYCVSEPCAYLSGGEIVVGKTKYNGITVAVSKEMI